MQEYRHPEFARAAHVVPTTTERRTITLAFGSDGHVLNANPSMGAAQVSTEIDQQRCYEVRLDRFLVSAMSTTSNNYVVQLSLTGDHGLPHPLGYGPGNSHEYVTLTDTDFTTATAAQFDQGVILGSDVEGGLRFGRSPKVQLRDGVTGAAVTWTYIFLQLSVLTQHEQKTFGG